jgi:peptidoglycan/xylan/chitin deacetylase (PgdA/CDA1 family)
MKFTYAEYRNLLAEINLLGRTMRFCDWKSEKVFLIRHDVDFDITRAFRMAEIEKESNIVATYFILTTSESFNVLTEYNRTLLREISKMGHEIGLHFDPSIYSGNPEKSVAKEAEILSYACGDKINSISIHYPSIHGQYPIFKGYVNTYDPIMFSDKNYISDSGMDFRGKNIFEWIKKVETMMIQILLHPFHFSESGNGYDAILSQGIIELMNRIHESMNVSANYRKKVGDNFNEVIKKHL